MLLLLALLILGIVWVASALIDNDAASMESLYGIDVLAVTSACPGDHGMGPSYLGLYILVCRTLSVNSQSWEVFKYIQ